MGRSFIVFAACFVAGAVAIAIALFSRRPRVRGNRPTEIELLACASCGYLNRPKARYCAQCGASLTPAEPDA